MRRPDCGTQRTRVSADWAHATREIAVLKSRLALRDPQVGVQEYGRGTTDHCAVNRAHYGHT